MLTLNIHIFAIVIKAFFPIIFLLGFSFYILNLYSSDRFFIKSFSGLFISGPDYFTNWRGMSPVYFVLLITQFLFLNSISLVHYTILFFSIVFIFSMLILGEGRIKIEFSSVFFLIQSISSIVFFNYDSSWFLSFFIMELLTISLIGTLSSMFSLKSVLSYIWSAALGSLSYFVSVSLFASSLDLSYFFLLFFLALKLGVFPFGFWLVSFYGNLGDSALLVYILFFYIQLIFCAVMSYESVLSYTYIMISDNESVIHFAKIRLYFVKFVSVCNLFLIYLLKSFGNFRLLLTINTFSTSLLLFIVL